MNILKKWARRILKDEIQKNKKEFDEIRSDYFKIINEKAAEDRKNIEALKTAKDENTELRNKITDLEKQIAILNKYYNLDQEPTDEEKLKIRVDLKIHELEMQIIKERIERFAMMNWQPFYNPYPLYAPLIARLNY